MTRLLEGTRTAKGIRIALVVSRFNESVTTRLLAGAEACLARHGGDPALCTVVRVPGAWELPLAAGRLAATGRFEAIVALGALVRGETVHFDHIATQVARGLGRVGLESGLPVTFGVLTTETEEQALARSDDTPANKGWEATEAAVELVNLFRTLDPRGA